MAKKDDKAEHEPLTEEQRITALEEKVGNNKIVLIAMALLLVVLVSVSSTVFVVSMMNDDQSVASNESVAALDAKLAELAKTLENIKKVTKENRADLALLKDQVATSSNKRLQQILIEQERGHQLFLETLRTGMYDLAHMIPGSRTWLEVYGEKINSAERFSKEREKELTNLQKGIVDKVKSVVQEDPFEDGF